MTNGNYRFTGPARVVRGLVLGSVVLLLTAVAHASDDHTSPTLRSASLVWLLPLAGVLSVAAADRRRTRTWLAVYFLGVQSLLHVMLVVNAAHASHPGSVLPSATMIAAHVLAAVGAAALVAHADAVLHHWLRFLDCLARDYLVPPSALPTAFRACVAMEPSAGHPLGTTLALTPQRRGPPAPTPA